MYLIDSISSEKYRFIYTNMHMNVLKYVSFPGYSRGMVINIIYICKLFIQKFWIMNIKGKVESTKFFI